MIGLGETRGARLSPVDGFGGRRERADTAVTAFTAFTGFPDHPGPAVPAVDIAGNCVRQRVDRVAAPEPILLALVRRPLAVTAASDGYAWVAEEIPAAVSGLRAAARRFVGVAERESEIRGLSSWAYTR